MRGFWDAYSRSHIPYAMLYNITITALAGWRTNCGGVNGDDKMSTGDRRWLPYCIFMHVRLWLRLFLSWYCHIHILRAKMIGYGRVVQMYLLHYQSSWSLIDDLGGCFTLGLDLMLIYDGQLIKPGRQGREIIIMMMDTERPLIKQETRSSSATVAVHEISAEASNT